MKDLRSFVANRRDGFHSRDARFQTILFERFVEQAAHAAAAMIGMDTDQVNVPDVAIALRPGNEAEQKPDHDPVVFDDARHFAELIKEDRVSERAGRTAPPTIDDLHDEVVVSLLEGPAAHLGGYTTLLVSSLPGNAYSNARLARVNALQPCRHRHRRTAVLPTTKPAPTCPRAIADEGPSRLDPRPDRLSRERCPLRNWPANWELGSGARVEACRVRRRGVDGKGSAAPFGAGHAVPPNLLGVEIAAIEHPADGRPFPSRPHRGPTCSVTGSLCSLTTTSPGSPPANRLA